MNPERQEYKGHRIELRARERDERPGREVEGRQGLELFIDDQPVPYGQMVDGSYTLREYAFDPDTNLMDLAKRFIDYRDKADRIRRGAESRR